MYSFDLTLACWFSEQQLNLVQRSRYGPDHLNTLVTRYRHRLSKYLAINNIVSALFSGFIVVLFLVNELTPYETGCIMEYSFLLAVLLLCVPPIVVSYIQTSYNGGHPHYWFDLEADFIGSKAQNRKRLLLNEKRNSIIFTPDEFSNKKQQN